MCEMKGLDGPKPDSPRFLRSPQKTRKESACSRIFFYPKGPEQIRFGRQQLIHTPIVSVENRDWSSIRLTASTNGVNRKPLTFFPGGMTPVGKAIARKRLLTCWFAARTPRS